MRHLRAVRELLAAGLTIEDVRALVTALDALPPEDRPGPESPPRAGGTGVTARGPVRAGVTARAGGAADARAGRGDRGEQALCEFPMLIVRRRMAYLDERIERLTKLRDRLAQQVGRPCAS
ncbi:hypothetical protein NKH77_21790 [Streptomyces sp. M19]